jgi:hypothetical protein
MRTIVRRPTSAPGCRSAGRSSSEGSLSPLSTMTTTSSVPLPCWARRRTYGGGAARWVRPMSATGSAAWPRGRPSSHESPTQTRRAIRLASVAPREHQSTRLVAMAITRNTAFPFGSTVSIRTRSGGCVSQDEALLIKAYRGASRVAGNHEQRFDHARRLMILWTCRASTAASECSRSRDAVNKVTGRRRLISTSSETAAAASCVRNSAR